MTNLGLIVLVLAGTPVLGIAFYKFAGWTKRKDRPGPHNNWRKSLSTSNSSGWDENGAGGIGASDGDGDGDGGGGD